MASQNFNTSNKTFRQMFGNGLSYRVPMFQRDYSWDEDQWDDLWNDIVLTALEKENPVHYMGYLVLSSKNSREYNVIDGQQRLTTVTLLILAGIKYLIQLAQNGIDKSDNESRANQLRSSYIGYLDPVTLNSQSKLSLNRANNFYFQTYIVQLEPLPKANRKFSEKLLRNAFEWLCKRIEEKFGHKKSGKDLAQFIEDVVDRLLFTVIEVDDELNAFIVFETLNSRGVKLAPIDLLKNYLFSIVHGSPSETDDRETKLLEERWDKITNKIGDANLTDFLRVYWNSKNSRVRESSLFKTVRQTVTSRRDVFELVRNLDHDAEVFAAFSDPESEVWNTDQKIYIKTLQLFKVKQPQALLLSAYRVLKDKADDFTRLLRACVIISFRYNIIASGATGDQETSYNRLAKEISSGSIHSASDIIGRMRDLYRSDSEFQTSFAQKSFSVASSKIAIYILKEIEKQSHAIDLDISGRKYDLEHIYPINPETEWADFPSTASDEPHLRLGNLTLLERNLNKDAGNKSFNDKKAIYKLSSVPSTKFIAEYYDTWGKAEITHRQDQMAKVATAIWRLPDFD
jgi:hypothetical protein